MSHRTKLIYLLSLNAILASALVALTTALLAGGGSAQHAVLCSGVERSQGERFVPINNSFDSISAAEGFICHEIAYPRSTPGWEFENISASRSGPAVNVGSGYGFASVTLDYERPDDPDADLRIEVSPYRIDPIEYGIIDSVPIMGTDADLIRGVDDGHFIMQWQSRGFSFFVEAMTTDGFDLTTLFDILNSIR
jgi:hypothetical protein